MSEIDTSTSDGADEAERKRELIQSLKEEIDDIEVCIVYLKATRVLTFVVEHLL